jgi:hypothetical protein
MSDAEELERLAALRDRGVLSAKEFEAKKKLILERGSAPAHGKRISRNIVWLFLLGALAGGVYWLWHEYDDIAVQVGHDCASDAMNRQATKLFDGSPTAQTSHLRAINLSSFRRTVGDVGDLIVECQGDLRVNNGQTYLYTFRMERDPKLGIAFKASWTTK